MKVFELFERLKELMQAQETAELDVKMTIDLHGGQYCAPVEDFCTVREKYVMLIYEEPEEKLLS